MEPRRSSERFIIPYDRHRYGSEANVVVINTNNDDPL